MIFLDAAVYGSILLSIFACPIWFLASAVKNIVKKPGWRIALIRLALPLLTLGIVVGNSALQSRIAKFNAERIVVAVEQFRSTNGSYPNKLDELVPRYLEAVPRAKFCLVFSEFMYLTSNEQHTLMWVSIPPFGRPTYNFEQRKWGYLD